MKKYICKFKNDRNQVYDINIQENDKRLLNQLIEKYIPREYFNDCGDYQVIFSILQNANEEKMKRPTGIILEQSKPFIPNEITPKIRNFFDSKNIKKISDKKDSLVITGRALSEVRELTSMGNRNHININEQMGLLIGYVYANKSVFIGIVEHFILSSGSGNRISVDVSHSDWADMQKRIDQINEREKKEYRIVGWWHTHPDMDVFMSQADIDTQKKYFSKDWQFAMVFNPQQRKVHAYCGSNPIKEVELCLPK